MTRRDSTYFYFEIIPVCCSSPCVLVITNSIISLSFIISQIDFWNDIVNFNDLEISQFKKNLSLFVPPLAFTVIMNIFKIGCQIIFQI